MVSINPRKSTSSVWIFTAFHRCMYVRSCQNLFLKSVWCVHCVSWTDFVEVFARNWRSLEAKNGEIWLFSQLSFGLKYRYGKWYFILFLVPLRNKVFLLGVLKMIIITSSLLHINKAFQNEHVKIYSYPKSKFLKGGVDLRN